MNRPKQVLTMALITTFLLHPGLAFAASQADRDGQPTLMLADQSQVSAPERIEVARRFGQKRRPARRAAEAETVDVPAEGPVLTEPVRRISGPKRIVAVGQFDAVGSFKAQYGSWDIGGGVAAMLTDALQESGQFIVLERAQIAQLFSEQEFKGQGLLVDDAAPQIGQILGVQLLLYGSITAFGQNERGGGLSLGVSGLSSGLPIGGSLGTRGTSGSFEANVRVVDATSSRIVHSFTVRKTVRGRATDFRLTHERFSFGGDRFMKSALGDITRDAVTEIVHRFAHVAEETPWTGRIVDVDAGEVYINAGADSGVRVGDQFVVRRVTKTFTDPETGRTLGQRKKELGTVEITGVEPELGYGFYIPLASETPQRGDLVLSQ